MVKRRKLEEFQTILACLNCPLWSEISAMKFIVRIDQQQVEFTSNKKRKVVSTFHLSTNSITCSDYRGISYLPQTDWPLNILQLLCSGWILLRSQLNTNVMFPYSKMTTENNLNQLIFVWNITREAEISCDRDNVQSYISEKMFEPNNYGVGARRQNIQNSG